MIKKINLFLLVTGFWLLTSAFSVSHDFTVHLGPFHASRTDFTYGFDKNNYFVKSNVKTFGVFDTLYPFQAEYFTEGKVANSLKSTAYKYNSQSRFTNRSKEFVYDKNGNPILAVSIKNGKEKKQNLEVNDNNYATDLQTVFAELIKLYNEVKFCDSKVEVFDGKRRFDVIFKDEGLEEISQGLASKCSMFVDKLNETGDELLWEITADKPAYFWIMKDKKTKIPFIAQALIEDTPLGKLEVHTNKVTINE